MSANAGDGVMEISEEEYKRLQGLAEQAEELGAKFADIERLAVFSDAGFDLDNPTDQVFIKGYDGDLSVEAVQSAANAAGWEFSPADDGPQWDSTDMAGEQGVSEGSSMKEALEDAARQATNQDDLNQRIIEVYRAYGETVASDLE